LSHGSHLLIILPTLQNRSTFLAFLHLAKRNLTFYCDLKVVNALIECLLQMDSSTLRDFVSLHYDDICHIAPFIRIRAAEHELLKHLSDEIIMVLDAFHHSPCVS